MEEYDVIIIGSGLSGLQCGYILSQEGFKVLILEQHKQVGGCLQNFNRNDCVFDTGIHYIGGLDEGQSLNRYFKYFDILPELEIQRLDEKGFDKLYFADDANVYPFAMGHENFVEGLSEFFPKEKVALNNYVEKLKNICSSFPLYNIEHQEWNFNEVQLFSENANAYFKEITRDIKLQNVLAGTNPLYAGVPDITPLYVHALVNNSFIESSYRIVGGSSMLAEILQRSIEKNGGKILTSTPAKEFIFKDKKLVGVITTDGESFFGKQFISSIHPANTMKMVEDGHLRNAYRERIMGLRNTTSNFTLYVVFKENSFPYLNHNAYFHKYNDVWISPSWNATAWPYNFLLITPASSKNQQYADCATVMAYMDMDEVRKWENTSIGKRGEDYENFKEEKKERLIQLVEQAFPGFKNSIKKIYTSSPLTYRDYTGTVDGSMYGILKDCNDPLMTLISPKTKIPNLFLTGQNIILHGVLGVTIGSVTTCSELVGLKYLVDKIKKF